METIRVQDLERYWIDFKSLLLRWKTTEEFIASYCVCMDTAVGNPPLIPHFSQKQFPSANSDTWEVLVKYGPEYKSAPDYINKSKTELQLVKEFLNSIANVEKHKIWFLLSDVQKLESDHPTLGEAAKATAMGSSEQEGMASQLIYEVLENPITFCEIFALWVGKKKSTKIFSYNKDCVYREEDMDLIREIEHQLLTVVYNNELKTYAKRSVAGRELFFSYPANLAPPKASAEDGLMRNLIFVKHTPHWCSSDIEPVYFDRQKVFQKFPFLTPTDSREPDNTSVEPPTEAVKNSKINKQTTPLSKPDDLSIGLNLLNIPSDVWAGKTYQVVRDAMREKDFPDYAIAFVLFNFCGLTNKTQLGRLLHKDKDMVSSSYARHTNLLIAQANNFISKKKEK